MNWGATTLFSWMDSAFTSVIQTPMLAVVPAALNAIAPVLYTAMCLYVMCWGILLMYKQCSHHELMRAVLYVAATSALYQSENWNTYVVGWFTHDIPNWISSSLSGTQTLTIAQQFDLLASATGKIAAAGIAGASRVTEFVEIGLVYVMLWVTELLLMAVYFCFKLAAFMAIILCVIGPFVAWLVLFPWTRDIALSWGKQLVGYMIRMAALTVLASVAVQFMKTFLLNFVNNSAGGIDVVLFGMIQAVSVDFFCLLAVAMVPGLVRDMVGGMASAAPAAAVGAAAGSAIGRGASSLKQAAASLRTAARRGEGDN